MTMAKRRAESRSCDRSGSQPRSAVRSRAGRISSFDIIVENAATVSTITMPVAAETPPRKTSRACSRGPAGERQGEHEVVGVDPAVGEEQAPGEGDRQDEEVDRQHVEGKEPGRLAQMLFVDVLDHRHLELRGRKRMAANESSSIHDQGLQEPEKAVELDELGVGEHAIEQLAEAVVETEGDPEADAEEGDELDHRLQAMASTSPSWCSVRSRCRVPKRMAKTASVAATPQEVRRSWSRATSSPTPRSSSRKVVDTAFNCSAMYGTMPTTSTAATSAPSERLLP